MRRAWVLAALPALIAGAALGSPLFGQDAPAAEAAEGAPEQVSIYDYWSDRFDRMTVPVSIEGRGPYRFVVDTGAERTVISRELAATLKLGAGRSAVMHSMTEVGKVATVVIPALEVNTRTTRDIQAPALWRAHIGAEGMLGVDSLKSQRVTFDFKRKTMSVAPSRSPERRWDADTIVITARSRFGHLVLIDASVEGEKVWVVIDTGSQVTVGNKALRAKLERKRKIRMLKPIELMSVTGGKLQADYTIVKQMKIGGIDFHDLPIAFAEVHPFRKLKLTDRPAILLGMDSLRLFDRVSVDFATRKVRLLTPDVSELKDGTRMVMRQPGVPPAKS